jgi:hypothetical protein
MPESLTEVSIDYLTGLQLEGACAGPNAIRMGIPVSTQLAKKSGCIGASPQGLTERLGERLRAIIHP